MFFNLATAWDVMMAAGCKLAERDMALTDIDGHPKPEAKTDSLLAELRADYDAKRRRHRRIFDASGSQTFSFHS